MRHDAEQVPASGAGARWWRPSGKVLLLAALIALALATHGQMFTPVLRGLYLASEMVHLGDAHAQLRAENEALADSAEYLKTEEGRKLAARKELEALDPGERVVIIQEQPPSSSPRCSLPLQVRLWLAQQGAAANRSVHQALASLKCWLGTGKRASDAPGNSEMEDEGPS